MTLSTIDLKVQNFVSQVQHNYAIKCAAGNKHGIISFFLLVLWQALPNIIKYFD